MADRPVVTSMATGMFLVTIDDRREIVYVAGPPADRWAFWNGHVYHSKAGIEPRATNVSVHRLHGNHTLTAPMPATVIKVLVTSGTHVQKGATVVVLEAMKMELPVRALDGGIVTSVHCREGDLVQADQPLVEMQS